MRVFIDEMTVQTFVGIHAHEHLEPQPVAVSLELLYGCSPAEDGDRPFVDYERLCECLSQFLADKAHTRLLETLAIQIADIVFEEFPAIEELVVSLHKPKVREHSKRSGVELYWSRLDCEAFRSGQGI
ncbi:dihydroneopterin aldolase [Paraburkholderia caffeinilytica]|uniref:dihydroneopterin aldolase n=1 Tax=Paraburkholderia caffeinilytica TaxID=1761016 RepID=A0ABQ1NBJ6_9BURK|nr:dihydroneopterin aldolase [Paraburkholderia caffeinilytica]GGC67935.1 dihydroneopterin aldolase [Paraburkholderia caffeinilytica]CAB3804487.1 hypothetical protein LMG28690_06036 [Paraburkholderia caffeinilytica]